MVSTSASSVHKSFKYDVFLSFRGEDTRKSFVDHLYHALHQKGIITYKDDERIEKGERISEQLIRSIEESRFHIIVFSKNYASSSWCLDELVKIMECQKAKEQTAYPVFYDVEPTEVRHQSGAVGNAFAKHERGSRSSVLPLDCIFSVVASCCNKCSLLNGFIAASENEDNVARWRRAMKDAAGLVGWELKNTVDGHEAKFIQQIVKYILLKPHFINSSIDGKLVGMGTRVKSVVASLEIDSDDVRIIGIKGIGGGGKTTLARAVFDLVSIWFEGNSFVENVRVVSKGSGLKEVQKQVLSAVLNDQSIVVTGVSEGKKMLKKIMCGRRSLVVLDDVDDIDQLEALAGELTWLKPGSRIIVTTRDQQVLVAYGVSIIHDVNLLSDEEALCLFSRYAFKKEIPNQGYEELSSKVVHYASGLPLTIKVLGSHLCGRSDRVWEDAIERLKEIPEDQTLKRLELSYNGLENDEKEIFLDVVCMLKGAKKSNAIRILDSCGYYAEIGLSVLEQKSLITITDDDRLSFHDRIEEMGKNIVRRLHPNMPSRHSRLWIKEEIKDILVNESGTEATRSIKLTSADVNPTIIMKGLKNMKELRLLYIHKDCPCFREKSEAQYLEDDEVGQYLPDALRSLCWHEYPFWYLQTFQQNKLVKFRVSQSTISELWEGGERKVFNKLKFLDLRCSMLRTFDLRMTPLLESLDLRECNHFVILQLPIECTSLKYLNLSRSKVSNLNLGMTPNLENLDLGKCNHFVELSMPVECPNLKVLNLCRSKVGNLNLGMTPRLECLDLGECNHFVELHMPVECPNLKVLILRECKVSNLNLGLTPHLKTLHLEGCSYLQEIHAPVGCLKKLVEFRLSQCSNFTYFVDDKKHESADFDSVDSLKIDVDCTDVCSLHPKNNLPRFWFTCKYDEPRSSWSGNLDKLFPFGLCACENLGYLLDILCDLQHLRVLSLEGGSPQDLRIAYLREKQFQLLPDQIYRLKHLKSLEIYSCLALEQLPKNICRLESLEDIIIHGCKSLRDISSNICKLKCLKRLKIRFCDNIKNLPEELGSLESLKELGIDGTCISCLPQSIFQLRGLCIYGSKGQLESNGFKSLTQVSRGVYLAEL